jgi:uncharacterized protein DUF4019
MGTFSTTAMLAMALLLAGCGPPPAEAQKARLAEERAQQWLALMDNGDYGGSWEAATKLFQIGIAKDEWEARARRTQLGLGEVSGRSLVAARYTKTYRVEPPGEYVIVQYRTRFGGRPSTETLYMRLAADGQWKTSGYWIRWE